MSINKPFIFTYFKGATISTADLNDDVLSLLQFKKKLGSLGHFYTTYKNIEDLQLKFGQQLDKLVANGFIELKMDKAEPAPATINISHSKNVVAGDTINTGGGAFVVGDNITTKE
jgi:hypothetical protein